jgi:hypothetical protein
MKAKKYQEGGPVDPKKKKAVEAKKNISRGQQIEREKMIRTRESEDRAAAERIRSGVRSEVGPGKGRPSANTGNVTLSMAKSQATTSAGSRTPDSRTSGTGKYTRGQLADQLSGKKMQPVYKTGETMGYAKNREISAGPGYTMKPEAPKSRVAKSGVPTPSPKQTGLSAQTKAAIEKGKTSGAAIGKSAGEYTMDEARRKRMKLAGGGMVSKMIKRK